IERALLNPKGDDAGREAIVIGNASTNDVLLDGWRIENKTERFDTIAGIKLAAGESCQIKLTGQGVQLSNKGGVIVLKNNKGEQVHAVSYSKADAANEGRYIRFTT